jgi:release factor glutamine methyltransferase
VGTTPVTATGRLPQSLPQAGGELTVALAAATTALTPVSDTPRLDAELLLAHALGVEREAILLDATRFTIPGDFSALVERRMKNEPVAYIIGHRDFWSVHLAVGPGALIPRPDSETLIEAALDHFTDRAPPLHILDLGTGPGTLLLAAMSEFRQAQGLGIDNSDRALDYARANAAACALADRATFQPGNWADGIDGSFDLILCNPPYIGDAEPLMADVVGFEPRAALFAGSDGLDDYRRILPEIPRLLAPDGIAIIEIGHTQAAAVTALATAAGLSASVRRDLGQRDRALILSQA